MKKLIRESWGKLRRMQILQPKAIVEPLIREGSITMLYGPRGIGKSLLCQAVAYAVAGGRDFLGFKVPEARICVYADGEMSNFERQKRFLRIEGDQPSKRAQKNLIILRPNFDAGVLPDLETVQGQQMFESRLPKDAALIFIDNLSSWCRSGREDAEAWRKIQEWVMRLRALGLAIVLVHHANKRGGQRGTSMREDALDLVISLKMPGKRSRNTTAFEFHIEKIRHLPKSRVQPKLIRFHARKNRSYWSIKELSMASDLQSIIDLKKKGYNYTEIAKKLELDRSTIHRRLKSAKLQGRLK